MLRRVLSALVLAVGLAGLPVCWVLLSHESTASAAVRQTPPGVTVTLSVGPTVTVSETATQTVVQTVEQTATVARTATARSTATTHETTTVTLPGATVLRTLPGGQVVRTVVATPASPAPPTTATPSPSSPSGISAHAAGSSLGQDGGGSPVWPYLLGILVLVVGGVIGVLVLPRR
jgi:cobalamin biosynthesis Mg chelatase CobN